MDRISKLPEEILQRILYFLSQKQAVRTSVLSKSWRNIWCTRPNLDFSDDTFKGNKQYFLSVVNNTLQRYRDQRLCVKKFHLRISLGDNTYKESVSFLEKWVPRFTAMGVGAFRLSILSKNECVDMSSVVFKAESLKLLRLFNCDLGQNTPKNIPFVRLTVLRLIKVLINKDIFNKIVWSCPLLTTMLIEQCRGLENVTLEKTRHKYLKHFTFRTIDDRCSVEIDILTLETIDILGCKVRFHSHEFTNLKSLSLHSVEISTDSVEQSRALCIDAPNIKYFRYVGNLIPSISFTPTSNKWKSSSNVRFYIKDVQDAQSCFLKLSKQLQSLSRFGISLEIAQYFDHNIVHNEEDLNLIRVASLPSFLNCLFCICRPKIITRYWLMHGELMMRETEQKELIQYFCILRERGNQDLEDLRIEIFNNSRREWKRLRGPILLESALLDISHIRIRLKWRESCESSSNLLEL
ncbi:hypothetical protein MIMGU_mgv1a025180mg [Erythranthe guttata]|uniref:F-box domain-containing protein n=1 Tax=Erythranthe guttata TaxID=4155 RepID=A0A022RWI0_ERYGU|nr:hypothetical protein MIMGU_mgv1a025180mg [Erythranthe guttata]